MPPNAINQILKNKKVILLLAVITSFVIGYLTSPVLSYDPFSDAKRYDDLAMSILNENEYPMTHGVVTAPGYPIFLASIYKVFGYTYSAVYMIQSILLGLLAFSVFNILKTYLRLNLFFSFLVIPVIIAWPYFVLYENYLLTELLYTFLLILFVLWFLKASHNHSYGSSAISGLILGLAAHVRPIPLFLPLWIGGIIILFLLIKKNLTYVKKIIPFLLLATFIFYLSVTPWTLLATKKAGSFTPIAGTLPGAIKKSSITFGHEWKIYKTPGYEPGSEFSVKKLLMAKAKNIFRFWRSGASGVQAENLMQKIPATKYLLLLYRLIFYCIIGLFFYSLMFIKKEKAVFLMWLVIVYVWALHSSLFPYPRHALTIMPLVIGLAIYSFSQIYQKITTPQK